MQRRVLSENGERSFAVVLETGEEATRCLRNFAEYHGVTAARFTAVGAFAEARLGFYDLEAKEYEPIEVGEQVEVLSLAGDITVHEGEHVVHGHAVLGRRDGSTVGGHLLEGWVRPTLEVMVVEAPGHLVRRMDEDAGLPLIDLSQA